MSAGPIDVTPAPDPLVGKTLSGRYRVMRRIGGGGMGAVYEALHELIERRVAVKVLHAHHAADARIVKRFHNEARTAATLGHPNIVASTDMGRTPEGAPFLVLELLEGRDLREELAANGSLPLARALDVALQAASALGAAHASGIVHRDLKPDNVFLCDDGTVKLLDFGISKFADAPITGAGTSSGSVLGTPHYMAPEQIRDASKVDARADVYALAAVIYECLGGERPLRAETLPDLLLKIVNEAPRDVRTLRPEVPAPVARALAQALAKDPSKRPPSAAGFAAALAADEPPRPSRLAFAAIALGLACAAAIVAALALRVPDLAAPSPGVARPTPPAAAGPRAGEARASPVASPRAALAAPARTDTSEHGAPRRAPERSAAPRRRRAVAPTPHVELDPLSHEAAPASVEAPSPSVAPSTETTPSERRDANVYRGPVGDIPDTI